MPGRGDLFTQAEELASALTEVLQASFRDSPAAIARVVEERVVVNPEEPVKLFIDGQHRATLGVRMRCELDSRGTWLAVENSSITLTATVDRTPVFRYEYIRKPDTVPSAHLQIHAHRGALSQLLAYSGHPKAHDMSALHIPLGGSRFRPCLEDVVQFIAEELRVDVLPTWRQAVEDGRRSWRERQVRATVHDWQGVVADELRALGFSVEPPPGGVRPPPPKSASSW